MVWRMIKGRSFSGEGGRKRCFERFVRAFQASGGGDFGRGMAAAGVIA
jgi:hypothetical protein